MTDDSSSWKTRAEVAESRVADLERSLRAAMAWWEWHASWEGTPDEPGGVSYETMDGSRNERDDHAECRKLLVTPEGAP